MAVQHIYCISGLGADFRIFSKLKINDVVLHPIEWQVPDTRDTMASFAQKLTKQIKHPDPVLLGVSFGGMLATEMCKIIPVKKTIIISSGKHRLELPVYMRAAGSLRLHKAIPYWLVTRSNVLNRFIFDARSREEELYLKQMMLKDTDTIFIKRSVNMILNWQRCTCDAPVVHVHGKRDKLLLPGYIKADYWIKDGGHFMVWNMADEISAIIQKEINGLAY
jgi:pimeloyl-ACP methyl ester carboxylesterase